MWFKFTVSRLTAGLYRGPAEPGSILPPGGSPRHPPVLAFAGKATVGLEGKLCMKHSNHRAIVQMDRLAGHLRTAAA